MVTATYDWILDGSGWQWASGSPRAPSSHPPSVGRAFLRFETATLRRQYAVRSIYLPGLPSEHVIIE